MKLKELAERTTAHLRRLAEDKEWNKPSHPKSTMPPLVQPWVCVCGVRLGMIYRPWDVHNPSTISKAQAVAYLEWLDAGGKGQHFQALRELGL